MSVKVSQPIPGSARAREWELREKVMGKRPANATTEGTARAFTGSERTNAIEAFGALWLAVREWWASWFELTPRARKILRRTLIVMWVVWALFAPYAAGWFLGGYVLPAWVIVRVWRTQRAVRRRLSERKARKRARVRKGPRVVTVTFGRV